MEKISLHTSGPLALLRIPLPVFLLNVRFQPYLRFTEFVLILLSFVITNSILFAVAIWILLTVVEHARFFQLRPVRYPVIDSSRLAPVSERRTSGVLDRNRLKDEGLLPSYYPDCICGLFFHDKDSTLAARDWLLSLTQNKLDDHDYARLRIVVVGDLSYYFVCLLMNTDRAATTRHANQSKSPADSANCNAKPAVLTIYDVTGTEFVMKFTTNDNTRPDIEAFVDTAKATTGCAVCLGIDPQQILADVFIIRDFKVLDQSELSFQSREYRLLRQHGLLP